jgi:hypothetical protein
LLVQRLTVAEAARRRRLVVLLGEENLDVLGGLGPMEVVPLGHVAAQLVELAGFAW